MIHHNSMTSEQRNAVAQFLANQIVNPILCNSEGDTTSPSPVVPGEVVELGDSQWARFENGGWWKLTDTFGKVPVEADGYQGFQIVLDADGRPLGSALHGLLIVHEFPYGPSKTFITQAHLIQTGLQWISNSDMELELRYAEAN